MWKLQFFEQIYFFHEKWFFSNGECNLDNGSKEFSLRVHTFAAQIPKTTKRSGIFWNDKKSPQNVPMYMYKSSCDHSAEIFSSKLWNIFCWVFGNEEKIISLPKNIFVKIFVWTCTTNFWQACRNHATKSTENFFPHVPKR